MPDPDEFEPTLPLTSADDERVRRLLADARHDSPMPADVVARLDGVLADLAASRDDAVAAASPVVAEGAEDDDVRVVSLDAVRRRQRRARSLLVAAAAVAVVGVGVPRLLAPQSGAPDAATAGKAADAPAADREVTSGDISAGQEAASAAPHALPSPMELRKRALKQQLSSRVADGTMSFADGDDLTDGALTVPGCGPHKSWGPGRVVAAVYNGQPALLILRSPRADFQRFDLYLCGADKPIRTVRLPVSP